MVKTVDDLSELVLHEIEIWRVADIGGGQPNAGRSYGKVVCGGWVSNAAVAGATSIMSETME